MATRLRLASVLVVVARWSTEFDAIFIISGVRSIAMIEDGYFRLEFSREKNDITYKREKKKK